MFIIDGSNSPSSWDVNDIWNQILGLCFWKFERISVTVTMLELCYLFGMVFNLGDLCNPSKANSIKGSKKRPSEKIGATLHLLKKLHINRPILSLGPCFGGNCVCLLTSAYFHPTSDPGFNLNLPRIQGKTHKNLLSPLGHSSGVSWTQGLKVSFSPGEGRFFSWDFFVPQKKWRWH